MKVGDTARRSRSISYRDIELFTELSGDRNPLHYDADAAARSQFGGIIVQGGVTSGLLNAVVAEDLPGPGSVFLHVDWSFRAPVRPGDVITAEVEVLDVREDKPISTLRTTISNQDDVVVLEGQPSSTAPPSRSSSRLELAAHDRGNRAQVVGLADALLSLRADKNAGIPTASAPATSATGLSPIIHTRRGKSQ